MKITRRQLRQIIESSVIKRGDDYVAPVEAPLTDPRDFDFDLSDENKEKLHALAGSDPKSGGPAQADSLADTLDFPSSGRFGADTLSKQTKMYDMGLDLINDPEIDQLLDRAIELSVKDNYSEHITDDLIYVLNAGYKYPEGPGGFQLFLNGDPDFNDENLDTDWGGLNTTVFHPGRPAITSDLITFVMRKMYFLIGIKLTGIQDSMHRDGTSALELVDDFSSDRNVEELAPEYLKQRFEKFKKVKELFKKRTSKARYPAIAQHVYDKLMKSMYEIFTTAHKAYKHVDPEIDMSQIKESKLKLSRRQLAGMIREMAVTPPSQDEENAAIIVKSLLNVGANEASIIQFFQLAVDTDLAQEGTLDFMELYPSGLIVSFTATEVLRDELNARINNTFKSEYIPKTYPKLYKVAYLTR